MTAWRAFAIFLLLTFALVGCAEPADPQETRLCRLIAPTLAPPGAPITILSQTGGVFAFAREGGRRWARIDYRVGRGPDRARFVECRFAERPGSAGEPDLNWVRTQDGVFPEPQLIFLKRFWLATPDAAGADPAPALGLEAARGLPFALAYGLQQMMNALPLMAVYALLAASYALVYGLVGRINLAFGEMAAAGGYAALIGFLALADGRVSLAMGVAAALALWTATLHSGAVAAWVFWPLRRASGQQALVATVGLSLFLQEYLRLTQGASLRWLGPIYAEPIALARSGDFVVTVTPVALMVAAVATAAGLWLLAVMAWTPFGRDWRASADDPQMAALMGVSPRGVLINAFTLAGGLAGLAGFVLTAYHGGVGYGTSTTLGLKALIAAILGGVGSVPGALIGGAAVGAFEALWSAVFPIVYRDVAVYTVLVAVLVFRPGGLLGWREGGPRQV
ncbi:MAG: branched-chain amino acid ABC transporter permease [Rhizobiales bacterium]|nr:branched-chain amino acid ABC transporter permease [Hyphomicrobiales bacterium]